MVQRHVEDTEDRAVITRRSWLLALALAAASGCASINLIPGTKVPESKINRELIEVCEKYRHALEDRDAATLLSMASPRYYEDSGTPKGDDDYGYEGLKIVLATRLTALRSVRYNIEYRAVEVKGNRARIDIRYDASFQIATEMGDRWERKQNDKRLELQNENGRWLFLAGM
jgi:hypothetical protein